MPVSRRSVLVASILSLVPGCTGKGPQESQRGGAAAVAEGQPEAPAKGSRELVTVTGPVRVEVLPQYDVLDRRFAPLDVHVLLRLRGEGEAAPQRPPLDLAVILDRSGSMAGEKLRAVKQATLDMLKELRPVDHLTLLAYDDVVDVLVERAPADAAGIDAARKAVLAIHEGGGTALGPGLYRGLEILEKAKRGESELAHVMLLSDGQANVGERNPEVLGARAAEGFRGGISVSTLGVGLDYNEDLMTKLADQGGGRYHFIQGTEEIPRVLSDEFAGLVATVAAGITLEMRMAPGVELLKVYGYPTREENGVAKISVGSLAPKQVREIVVKLRVNFGPGEEAALGVLALQASDLTRQGQKVESSLALAVATSTDEAQIRASERTEVTIRVAEVESAAQLEEAARAVERGDYETARKVLQASVEALEVQQKATPSPKLVRQAKQLKEAETELDAAKESAEMAKIYRKKTKATAYQVGK